MSDLLVKKLTAEDFDPNHFVQELGQNSVGGLELQQHRHRIYQLSEETNSQLKKNVYLNYMQFIETAKEILYLEGEMYQLSHLITEQKSLLNSLLEVSISGGRTVGASVAEFKEVNPEEIREKMVKENRKKLTALLEKVEGCSHVMEVPDRYLVFDGDLVELNQEDYSVMHRVHLYLLNDSFMVAVWLSDRRGPVRYRFERLYPLDQVLPVNIKDRRGTKDAFKLLIFPETRVFQASKSGDKQDWLDQIEHVKNNKMAEDKKRAEKVQEEQHKERQASLSKDDSLDSNNPFLDDDSEDVYNPFVSDKSASLPTGPPEWVEELPEELDQAIAQRNFEDAVALIDRGREFFDSAPKTPVFAEMRRGLENRVKTLVDVLQAELRVSPQKSLQGGPRAARRATLLLIHLNRTSQACTLFLKHREAILKASVRRLRLEGKTVLFIRQLCSVFFKNLLETGKEFRKAFPSNRSTMSAFIVWAQDQINHFSSLFSHHVFASQPSLTVVAECVSCADRHCLQLSEIGLDVSFLLHTNLLRDVERYVRDGRDKMVEAVKLRAQEDAWKSLTFDSNEHLMQLMDELKDFGIANIQSYVCSDMGITLTDNMIQFTRAFLAYVEDVLRLFWPETQVLVNDSLMTIISAQLRHCRQSLDDPLFSETLTIRRNIAFLLDVVLSTSEHRYAEVTGHPHPTLSTLHALRPSLMADFDQDEDAPKTVSKYESHFL